MWGSWISQFELYVRAHTKTQGENFNCLSRGITKPRFAWRTRGIYCIFLILNKSGDLTDWGFSTTLTEVLLTTLTEVFPCFFLSCKANAGVKPAKTGHGPHSFQLCCSVYFLCCSMYFCVLCIVCFVTFPAFFVCVYVCWTTASGWLPNCSKIYHISSRFFYDVTAGGNTWGVCFAFHVAEGQIYCIKLEYEIETEFEYLETTVTNQNCVCE